MKFFYPTILLLIVFMSTNALGQSGVRGTLHDELSGETIPFADIVVQNTTNGTNTDLDGAYELRLDPGTYTLVVSYLGYEDLVIQDIIVSEGEYTVLDAQLGEASESLAEVVVTAQQVKNNEAAVVSLKRNTASFLDGISSQTFKRTGDSDAASAIKRVPGISIEGGQYVFVRGLGDRYSKTLLNGIDIPGLDPDRNAVQLDLFPTNLIDNILVYKTFTPDLPGDFSGGLVQITTKDFPEQEILNVSVGVGINTNAHFRDDFVREQGPGASDLLGTDINHRELPWSKNQFIPTTTGSLGQQQLLENLTSRLNPDMGVERASIAPNFNLSLTYGNQKALKKGRLGYTFTFSQRRESTFDPDTEFRFWEREVLEAGVTELVPDVSRFGARGQTTDQISALAGLALKFDRHKFGLSAMRTQQGISTAAEQRQTGGEDNTIYSFIYKDLVEYNDRNLTNVLLSGKHNLASDRLEVKWSVSPSFATSDDPDVRQIGFEELDNGNLILNPASGALIERVWRFLDETTLTGRADAEYKLPIINGQESKIKVGAFSSYKDRDFSVLANRIETINQPGLNLQGEADNVLAPDNIWSPETNSGSFVVGNIDSANIYEASQQLIAGYGMTELQVSDRLKAILGARVENATLHYTGQNSLGTVRLDDEETLNETNVLPSASLIYKVTPKINLRASYAQTVARPTFKEKSLAQIVDRVSGTTFIGNLDVEQTEITNYDIRLENLLTGGQSISISAFYKSLDKPIELVVFNEFNRDAFTPRNMGDGEIYGLELEANRNLEFIGLPELTIQGNLTLVESSVERDSVEYNSKLTVAEKFEGETVDRERQMAFQSPYIINAAISYATPDRSWEANINYNVQGERLVLVGIGQYPDVFERPFHSVNARISHRINEKLRISASAGNLFNQKRVREFQAHNAEDRVFSRIAPGQTFSLSIGYRFI